jgi:hypothetical protein
VTIILASLNPVRLVDEVTDRLGALLIDGAKSLSYLVKHLTTLPAGFQVVIALVGVGLVALLVALTLRAFGDARGIWSRFRRASADSSKAKADLATGDRRKALGYLLLVGALVCLAALVAFVYHSWEGPSPPSGFRGR